MRAFVSRLTGNGVVLLATLALPSATHPETPAGAAVSWPQFRGRNGQGVSENDHPPIRFGASEELLWKTELPSGVSSPIIWGDRIFLTGFSDGKLETICLGRGNGEILWRRLAPTTAIEKVHEVSSPAAPTPVTDGKRVYAYFGSYGLLAYSFDGKQAWHLPLS